MYVLHLFDLWFVLGASVPCYFWKGKLKVTSLHSVVRRVGLFGLSISLRNWFCYRARWTIWQPRLQWLLAFVNREQTFWLQLIPQVGLPHHLWTQHIGSARWVCSLVSSTPCLPKKGRGKFIIKYWLIDTFFSSFMVLFFEGCKEV